MEMCWTYLWAFTQIVKEINYITCMYISKEPHNILILIEQETTNNKKSKKEIRIKHFQIAQGSF